MTPPNRRAPDEVAAGMGGRCWSTFEAAMEIIWRKGLGMKIAIAPRSVIVIASLVAALQAPEYLPQWFTIFRAALAGSF